MRALVAALLLVCGGCAVESEPPARAWFADEAAERGLDFVHDSGHRGAYLMPEAPAGGAGLFDMDGDGDLDAYLVQSGPIDAPAARGPNRLYENLGDGRFRDVSEGSGSGDTGYGMGLACGDYDEDGDVDLYVTNLGPDVLLRNEGGGRFTDVTADAGLGDPSWGSSAGFFDYDADGDLDLFVVNYLRWSIANELECFNSSGAVDYCGPLNYDAPAMDRLYRNDGGRFTDVTRAAGMDAGFGNGLGYVFGDFNGDGRLDIFVANDGLVDQLWVNRGDGTFVDEALLAGCAVDMEGGAPKAGMGVTAGDVDDDGDLDLMVCNLVNESDSVYRNEGDYFTDVTAASGLGSISKGFTRFGMGWVDLDNDGRLDLYQANGRVMKADPRYDSDDGYAEPNLLFRGLGEGRFEEVRPRGGTAELSAATSRAAAFGDVDGDGGVDILVANRDAAPYLLINRAPRGNWISLAVLERGGRHAEGAELRLTVEGRTLRRDVRGGFSYLACNDPRVHVGLGSATSVEQVEVRWVDGTRERFGVQEGGRTVVLRRGAGQAI